MRGTPLDFWGCSGKLVPKGGLLTSGTPDTAASSSLSLLPPARHVGTGIGEAAEAMQVPDLAWSLAPSRGQFHTQVGLGATKSYTLSYQGAAGFRNSLDLLLIHHSIGRCPYGLQTSHIFLMSQHHITCSNPQLPSFQTQPSLDSKRPLGAKCGTIVTWEPAAKGLLVT